MSERKISQDEFTRRLADMLAGRIHGLSVEEVGDDHIVLVLPSGGKLEIFTDNSYQAYLSSAPIEGVFEQYVDGVISYQRAAASGRRGLPAACIRSTEWLNELRARGSNPYFRPIAGDIGLVICLDGERHIQFLSEADAPDRAGQVEAYERRAISNIRSVIGEIRELDLGEMAMYVAGGDYESSLILLEDAIMRIARRFGRRFLFAIPNRDVFLVAPDDPMARETLRRRAERSFTQNEHPISRLVFQFDDGVISVAGR